MSSDNTGFFKIKPTKRSNPEERTTLDTIHQFQVRKILNDKNEVEDIETEYNKLAEEIDATDDDLIRGQLEAKLKNLELSINEKTRDDKIDDYFLKTGPILFDYYEVQNAISKGIRGSYMKKIKGKPGDVLTALQEASKQNDISNSSATIIGFDSKSSSDEEEAPAKNESSNTLSRDTLLDKYLQKINPAYSRKNSSTLEDDLGTCPECGKDMIFAVNEAMLYCNHCNYNEFILIDSDRPSYKDPPRESSYYAYKRINHFNELLAQFQAKENTGIDDEIFESIVAEIKKQRITDLKKLTNVRLREILKKLKLNRLYDHINYIMNRLNGTNAAIIDRDTEEKLRHMFKEIQPAFQKHCPKDRRNFLAYPYVLYKFCELLEMDDFLKNFQLLKNRDKLYIQDKTWEKICEEMRWQFIRTV
jgi:hypothetical protein